MKKISLLIISQFILMVAFAQLIPNNSFETWDSNPFPMYEEPTPWATPNPYTSFAGAVTVTKSEDAVSGNYSARLETIEIQLGSNTFQAPGLVTFADFNVNLATGDYTFGGGLFLQKRISKLSGKFKYQSAENDSATVLIYCFRHPEGQTLDTIGIGLTFLHDAESWSDFSVNMQYFNDEIPDTFNVLIMSTATFQLGYMPPGSVLLIDDLVADTAINAVPELPALQARLFPNPASDQLNIALNEKVRFGKLTIYDINGKMIRQENFEGTTVVTDVHDLANGIYTYQVTGREKLPVSGTFVKH